ncbi:MAG TPA: fatty acid--CoA ligase family protein [Acidobacteriaceae bacterium]|nr:fatty acid--CoA ligase family protein [Acidobacteriaceae bacterium]
MKTQQNNRTSLWHALRSAGDLTGRYLYGVEGTIAMSDLIAGTTLYGRGEELCGRSVLVMTANQFTTASALIELDGIARRIVICPPDLAAAHLPFVIDTAEVDAIVSDRAMFSFGSPRPLIFCPCSKEIGSRNYERTVQYETEWVLLTSGTTGVPKLVLHTLASLAGAIDTGNHSAEEVVWSTFYDIRRYGGLQILLRAALTGKSLVLTSMQEPTTDFLARAGAHGVTNISGTPSQWRRALMSPAANRINPNYVRLSGEIADQAILNRLRSVYPGARLIHAFASTEAGVAFEVSDGNAGLPAEVIMQTPDVEMKVEEGSLRIRSARTASCYLGANAPAIKDADGFVDTGDMLELKDKRYHFVGRRDGMINVGGLKVHPEEVEAVINRHPEVQSSLVRTRKNPVTGSLVVADVVLRRSPQAAVKLDMREIQDDIVLLCRESLSSYKVPAAINFVPALAVGESGKMIRCNA